MGVFQANQSRKPWQNWQKVKGNAKEKARKEAMSNVFSSEIQKLDQSFISQPEQHLSWAKQAWCQRSLPGQDMIWHEVRWSLVYFLWSLIPCCYWQSHTGIFIETSDAIPAIHMNSYSLTTQKYPLGIKFHSNAAAPTTGEVEYRLLRSTFLRSAGLTLRSAPMITPTSQSSKWSRLKKDQTQGV